MDLVGVRRDCGQFGERNSNMQTFELISLTRARIYPPEVGDDLPAPENIHLSAVSVDFDVEAVGMVTLSAEDPSRHDGRGVEFDLQPDDARRLATALLAAADSAGQGHPLPTSRPQQESMWT
jgi:hypothetical protein